MEPNDLKKLIKECQTKIDGKLNIPSIQKYLYDNLEPMKISCQSFYKQFIEELSNLLIEINNSLQKDNFFSKKSENLDYFYSSLDIFFCLTHCIVSKESKIIVNEKIVIHFIQTFINMLFKITSIKEKNKNNKDYNLIEIETFCEYINEAFKVLLDINLSYIINYIFIESNNNIFTFLLSQPFTRIILYSALQKLISNDNKEELLKRNANIIKDIFNYLIKESNSDNVKIIIQDIKRLSMVFKKDIFMVGDLFFQLIKEVLDFYSNEIKNEYENLFFFFFIEIVFEENINEKKKKSRYNKKFLDFLLDLYKYIIKNKKKELYSIFLLKLFESINYDDNKEGLIKGNISKKYSWLIEQSAYANIILDSFPEVFDKTLFKYYLMILLNLSNEAKSQDKKNEIFLPEIDLLIFFKNFSKYINNPNYTKENLIEFFAGELYSLINNNKIIIKIIAEKINAFDIIIQLIESEKDYNIKLKLFYFIEKILPLNQEEYEYSLNIEIRKKIDEINLKINLISIGYECNNIKFNQKLQKLLDIMNMCCDKKKINDFLQIVNLIFKIICDYQFKKLNIISDDILLHFNNLLLQMSSFFCNSQKYEFVDNEKLLEELIANFLNSIYKFIFRLNIKKFEYKAQRINDKNQIFLTKRIIEKKNLKDIIKNLLLAKNNPLVKKKAFEYLMNFSIDEKNNLILSSYILYIITNIYYQDKNYKNLQKIYNILLNLVKKFDLNGKILLNYDFVSISINILQEIFIKNTKEKEEEECYQTVFLFLEDICKFLNKELLMKYLNKLFILFNRNVLSKIGEQNNTENENSEMISGEQRRNHIRGLEDFYDNNSNSIKSYNSNDNGRHNIGFSQIDNFELENDITPEAELNSNEEDINIINNENDINNKPKICLNLFNILKKYLKLNLENDYNFVNNNTSNYIILSNYTFPNHLINNLLYLENLKYNKNKDIYIYFKIVLKISKYNEMPKFTLMQLRNERIKINFSINEKILEIKEECPNSQITLFILPNFDKELPADNKYHDCTIIFNIEEKTFKMFIDNKNIIEKSNKYKNFNFESFNMIMGFKNDFVEDKINNIYSKFSQNEISNKNNSNNNNLDKNSISFIYISYLLILNTLIEEEKLVLSIKNERDFSPNGNLLSNFYRKKNRNWAQNIISEIDFQNKNINITYSKKIKNKITDIKYFFSNSFKNFNINQYISYIETYNSFNDDVRTSTLYMISKNKNIYEYYSLNNIFELEKINKLNISSKIFDNYNLIFNFCNVYIFDFLMGFFFLMEKRFDELKNNNSIINENNKKENEGICKALYGDTYLINEEIIIDYILEIFEIMSLIPSENIKNYFYEGDSGSNILKIKFFFYRNICLLNDNETLIDKLLQILSFEKKEKEQQSKKKILLEILINIFLNTIIFGKLNFSIQNKILFFLNDLLNKEEKIKDEKQNECSLKLIESLVSIILYNKISQNEIEDGKTQIDYVVSCINLILSKSFPSKDTSYEEKLKNYFKVISNICFNFSKEIKSHLNNEIYEKYKFIFSFSKNEDDFEEIYDKKIEKLSNNIQSFYNLIKNNKIVGLFIKDNNNKKDCNFCQYLKTIFNIKVEFIYDELKFDKLYKKFFRNYYLNFGENFEIFRNKKYAWFLSLKESYGKIQNKLFLKENNIKHYSVQNPKNKKITNHFIYDYGKEYYYKTFKELYQISFVDKICRHEPLIKSINGNKKIINACNCLIINKLHKILSIIILYEDCIIIYYNLCIDNNHKIYIAKSETTHSLWTKSKKDFEKDFIEYLKNNDEEIKEEIYEIKSNNNGNKAKKKNLSRFYYNKCYKFSKRIVPLKKINEIYKRQHLHIPNALEIFLNNGESYFIVLNPENRDIVFDLIISNINGLYKNKANKLEIFKSSKLNQNNKEYFYYMKHCPFLTQKQSQESEKFLKNENFQNMDSYKVILDGNFIKDEIYNEWCKNKISNYDYLMLLNIMAGRSFNDLSQYFIFPWIIQDFNENILNWLSDKIYRDLSLPIHACGEDRERIINKYDLLDDEKYHSGTFYSTHSFVCYFLIRQRPFTEMHIEIQGSKFDAPSRMFNGADQLSNVIEKYQEFIPALFNLPELYIKTSCIFEENENMEEPIKDYDLPKWSKNDPRKFSLILRKLLENDNISGKLNLWIDLIFGNKQNGTNAIKALNVYRNACYSFTKNEFEQLDKNNELESYMYEKEELGCIGRQLFSKPHKRKQVNIENPIIKNIFFNDNDKLKNLIIHKIKNPFFKNIIKNNKDRENRNNFNKISDIIFFPYIPKKIHFYQGGLSSLSTIMNSLREMEIEINKKHIFHNNINNNKIVDLLTEENNFILLKNNYKYLNSLNLLITYNQKCIELINFVENESYFYFLNEIGDISCLTTNEKGTKLYVCFSDGKINQYKIEKISRQKMDESNYILPIFPSQLNELSIEYNNINLILNNFKQFVIYDINDEEKIALKKINKNDFSYNNPHIPKKINIIAINEYHNVLIALDESNLFYIISLNNNMKLMHISHFLSNTHYKMKEILPLSQNGDFIIYSSYTVYLFSINGIPLCQLNLFEKLYEDLNSITCCRASFLYDIVLFTAHRDGSILIWKLKNKDVNEKFEERISYVFNRKKSKFFLPEYSYGYNSKHNRNNESKIGEYELQRKFEYVNKIHSEEQKTYFIFMKMNNNMNYMILLDNKYNLYVLTNKEDNSKRMKKNKNKDKCFHCNKILEDDGIRPTLITANTISGFVDDDNTFEIINNYNDIDNNINKLICEECKQKLEHTENFLYNF